MSLNIKYVEHVKCDRFVTKILSDINSDIAKSTVFQVRLHETEASKFIAKTIMGENCSCWENHIKLFKKFVKGLKPVSYTHLTLPTILRV